MDEKSAPAPKKRSTEVARTARRRRIFARLSEGWAYDDIAREEKLTPRRIRQIVAEFLDSREVENGARHTLAQLARLGPALKTAGEAVAQGDVRAIAPLMKVLDRLDRYQKSAELMRPEPEVLSEGDMAVVEDFRRRVREEILDEMREEQVARQAAEAQSGGGASPSGGETAPQVRLDTPSTTQSDLAHQTTGQTIAGTSPGDGSTFGNEPRRPMGRLLLNGMAAG